MLEMKTREKMQEFREESKNLQAQSRGRDLECQNTSLVMHLLSVAIPEALDIGAKQG